MLAVTAAGCGAPAEDTGSTVTTVVTRPQQGGVGDAPGASPSGAPGSPGASAPPEGGDVYARLAAALPEGAGLAVAPVGGGEVHTMGTWSDGVAWSTAKVPLSVAALRHDPGTSAAVDRALTLSDNAAADQLWASLGGGRQAAGAVEQVLREGGDTVTTVPSEATRPGFSVFGQTRWSLADQTRFASGLPCLPDAMAVLSPMSRVDPSQAWGLARVPGALYKGGWGPGEDGSGYLVRQLGVLPVSGGRVAVATAVSGGSFEQGTAALSTIGEALARELPGLPAGECRR